METIEVMADQDHYPHKREWPARRLQLLTGPGPNELAMCLNLIDCLIEAGSGALDLGEDGFGRYPFGWV